MKEKESLFDKFYGAKEEFIKAIQKPLARKQLKRKFEVAYDDATDRIDKAMTKVMDSREKCHTMDVNELLKAKAEIRLCKQLQSDILEEYLEMFGKEMNVKDEE